MRNFLFLALAVTSACKWTDFDDLKDTTWVRSSKPDIGSSDYGVAIAGVSSGTSGGTLAVLSDDSPSFSTIAYTAKGDDSLGANPIKLGTQNIGAIADDPVFTTDTAGRIALVERSILGGTYAVVTGSATAPGAIEVQGPPAPVPAPDAAVFIPGGELVFAAGTSLYTIPASGTQRSCPATDPNAVSGLQVAAMDTDGTNLVVWTKGGFLISYTLADLALCGITGTGSTSSITGTVVFPVSPATPSLMPAPGARVHMVGGFAILTGHPTGSRSGSVFVVKLSDGSSTTLGVEGLHTSAIAVLGGQTYLAIGVPDRSVEGVAAGEVDLDGFNTTSGALSSTPDLSLHDAQPESGQLFGRTVTTMSFNGSPILVVGGDSEIYAYYRTTLYDNLP